MLKNWLGRRPWKERRVGETKIRSLSSCLYFSNGKGLACHAAVLTFYITDFFCQRYSFCWTKLLPWNYEILSLCFFIFCPIHFHITEPLSIPFHIPKNSHLGKQFCFFAYNCTIGIFLNFDGFPIAYWKTPHK